MTFKVTVLYDHPQSTTQVQMEFINSQSLDKAKRSARETICHLGWDLAHCYSSDDEFFQPMEEPEA